MAPPMQGAQTVDLEAKGRALMVEQLRSCAATYQDAITAVEAEITGVLEGKPSADRYLSPSAQPTLGGVHEVFSRQVQEALEAATC